MRPTVSRSRRRGGGSAPPPPSGAIPFFSDNFEGGQLNPADGFTWTLNANSSLSSGYAFDGGTHAVAVTYGPDAFGVNGHQSSAELDFSLGRGINEIWIEYKIHVPSNYFHRNNYNPGPPVTGRSDNNKFLAFWGTQYSNGYQQVTIEYNPDPGIPANPDDVPTGYSIPRTTVRNSTNGTLGQITSGSKKLFGVGSDYAGQVGEDSLIRVHYRRESSQGAADGYLQWWVNGNAMVQTPTGAWGASDPAKFDAQLSAGYVLGSSNSGFTEETTLYLGAFKFYDTDPEWT